MEEFKGPFSQEVSKALKHIKSAVTEYGAHYGFVICIGYDYKIWYGSTANMTGTTMKLPQLAPLLGRHVRTVLGVDAPLLGCEHICSIFGAGSKEKAKQNTFGIRNKIQSFNRIASKLAEEDPIGQFPVIAMISHKETKHYIVHPLPDTYPTMGDIEAHILDTMTLAEGKIHKNYPPFDAHNVRHFCPEKKQKSSRPAPISSRAHLKRVPKRNKVVDQLHTMV